MDDLKTKLEALPPTANVVWCEKCGHVVATVDRNNNKRLQDGDDNCQLTIADGTPQECIAAMCG